MSEYLTLEDYMGDEEREQIVSNAATQTQDHRTRKIKPIKHPGLILKTPIAYQPHTDLNCIPIRKDGIGNNFSVYLFMIYYYFTYFTILKNVKYKDVLDPGKL